VARFVMHDESITRTVSKAQIYNLIDQLSPHLPFSVMRARENYIHSSKELDKIRDPHPKFGWWWMPKAWRARWIREAAKKKLLYALTNHA
jgi:hypothetical protein